MVDRNEIKTAVMKERIPRKLKKRWKKAELERVAKELLRGVIFGIPRDGHADIISTPDPDILLERIPPMTDEQKKAWCEEHGIHIHTVTMTPEEAMERYGLNKED